MIDAQTERILVLGLGNVLMGDDGLGPHAIRRLEERYAFPRDVALLDAGTPGFELLAHVVEREALIVVDAIRTSAPPGTVVERRGAEIVATDPPPRIGPHQPTLCEVLLAAEFRGLAPAEMLLIGIVPDTVEPGTNLSPLVCGALPVVEARVLAELDRLGAPAQRRDGAREATHA